MLAYAHKVVFVPGYGLAVAQAQHDLHQLADLLEAKGVEVSYAIHPVAGRMPGHMNVLLAEANVPYDELHELDEANGEFPRTDVVVVVGANDVVNPDARIEPGLADLRHADPQRRRRAGRRRPQALDEPGLRRHREPALLQPEDRDAVRRREGLGRQAHRRRQEPLMAVVGAHMLLYTPEPEELRATLRDVFGLEFVESHPGWLIFKLPPAELGVHPGESTKHEVCFMCDDLPATVAELRAKGIEFEGEPQKEDYGETIVMVLPGGVRVLLYQPTHLSPLDL